MGRMFEARKATMYARWDRMAKAFTRVSREIVIAVKAGGDSVDHNPSLRRAIQNARAVNMPRDKIESAIKRALGADTADYQEVLYEGYAAHGVAIMVVTATDNPTRTVATVRHAFKKNSGNMGNSGSVSFLFGRMGVFRLKPDSVVDLEELELELIDHGLEETGESVDEEGNEVIVLRCAFSDFGQLQAGLEEMKLEPVSTGMEYIAANLMELPDDQAEEVMKLIDVLEQDDDVQHVFHNLA